MVDIMYIDDQTRKLASGKINRRVLLRNSYRVNGKVCHDTIANLSACSDEEISALKLAIKNKNNLSELTNIRDNLKTQQGLCVGATWLLSQASKKLGIHKCLGFTREAKLAQWLIFATIIEQGSRLSATRLATRHAACDILNIPNGFNEDDLYKTMDWLEEKQSDIEHKLFGQKYKNKTPSFYLYDVTSSYFEGQQNELAAFGYNRDKKQGKPQIVIGLMTDDSGYPIAIEVFEGNTQDPKTVSSQIKKLAERFGVKEVALVGDRGMIKSHQITELNDDHQFNYITAISKSQIEKLIKEGVIQYNMFDKTVVEIEDGGVRYMLRRNPIRAEEIENTRQSKLDSLRKFTDTINAYLLEHPRAKTESALKKVKAKIKRLRVDPWVIVIEENRIITIKVDEAKKNALSKYDGCYVIKTDLPKEKIETQKTHDRYKQLAFVENAFRTMKTALLEMRPIFVRKANRTRAHVFIIMLAYMIEHQLRKDWRNIDVTVAEGIAELSSICSLKIQVSKKTSYQTIPAPRELGKQLLKKSGVSLPSAIPSLGAIVHTRKTLVSER